MSFNLFICFAAIAVLLFVKKAIQCISSRFYCRTIAFAICVASLSAKMLQLVQVIYFVIRCEAKFSKVRLEIFKGT